jgi:hypothetical protein
VFNRLLKSEKGQAALKGWAEVWRGIEWGSDREEISDLELLAGSLLLRG